MATSTTAYVREVRNVRATNLEIDDDGFTLELDDGRTLTVPIVWFPRLSYSTQAERENWQFLGDGVGIHWPDLDEDISVRHLLDGRGSNEGRASLKRWLDSRAAKEKTDA